MCSFDSLVDDEGRKDVLHHVPEPFGVMTEDHYY